MKTKNKITTVDEFIASQSPELQSMLQQIRTLIRSIVPAAEEVISYQVPIYKYHGMLTGFGVRKDGCSLYTMNAKLLQFFPKEMTNIKYSGSTLHFDPKKALPVALIKKIIRQRMKANEAKAIAKNHAKLTQSKSKGLQK